MYEKVEKKNLFMRLFVMLGNKHKQLHIHVLTVTRPQNQAQTHKLVCINVSTDQWPHYAPLHTPRYLVQSEGPDGVGGQLHRVQQSDLDEAVGLRAPRWPVLIALHLQGKREGAVRAAERFARVCTHFCDRRES